MNPNIMRIVLFVIDALIVVCIALGFFNLKKFVDSHKESQQDEKQEGIKNIIRRNGIALAVLGFIAIVIGVTSKLL